MWEGSVIEFFCSFNKTPSAEPLYNVEVEKQPGRLGCTCTITTALHKKKNLGESVRKHVGSKKKQPHLVGRRRLTQQMVYLFLEGSTEEGTHRVIAGT